MSAEHIATALGGKHYGGGKWSCRCPAHDDARFSLGLRDGDRGVLVTCFAGCEARDVIDELRRMGLWSGRPASSAPKAREPLAPAHDPEKMRRVMGLWRDARPIAETPAARYLLTRGITLPPPPSLRFSVGSRWPAMIGLVTVDREIVGVHRTFLRPDGSGKAPVDPPKSMLGRCGGGAVRLAPASPTLAVAEGIETALSFMQLRGVPTWAALSTAGLAALRLPPEVREIVVAADADAAGRAAAEKARARWLAEGRTVRVEAPDAGKDFNDQLRRCHAA